MKKTIQILLCAVLVFCVSAEAFCASAYADFSCTEGEYFETCISQTTGEDDAHMYASAAITSGNCPGVSVYVGKNGTGIMLGGTAEAAGTYMLTVSYTMRDGQSGTATAILNVNPGSSGREQKTVQGTLTLTEGQDAGSVYLYAPVGKLDDISLSWNGLTVSTTTVNNTYGLFLSGKPEAEGEHVFSAANIADGDQYEVSIEVTVIVSSGKLNVTKSPTDETVTESEEAWFIAHCDNDVEIQWRLVNANGSVSYRNEEITAAFPGIRVSGLYTDELHLENIPLSAEGWYVQARFTDKDGNSEFSETARLTVKAKPVEEKEETDEEAGIPVETPEPAEEPEPVEEEPAEDVPEVPEPVSVIEVAPEAPEEPEPEKKTDSSNALIFIIAGIGGAAVVAITVAAARLKQQREERRRH